MTSITPMTDAQLHALVERVVMETPVTDIHTHIYPTAFGNLLHFGIDELLTYHYLVAETFRWLDIPYENYWQLPKRDKADLVWHTLFIENSPISEACRGVLTTLEMLGLDPGTRDLDSYRRAFAETSADQYLDMVFERSGVARVVMTNDPFNDDERAVWENDGHADSRFKAVLRLDMLLNTWTTAIPHLQSWGYRVGEALTEGTLTEVRRFLRDWIQRMEALYLAVVVPPDFRLPEASNRSRLITEAILPICRELDKPLALMIGAKKHINPNLGLAGDAVGKCNIEVLEYLCATYPMNKFMVTLLARENQHELCVIARKFRNLLPFGCWWFLNNPSLIDEITRMRLEMLGTTMVPQHSDVHILDQLLYKWSHSRHIIGNILYEKYHDVQVTGWHYTETEIRRDATNLLGGMFWKFLGRQCA